MEEKHLRGFRVRKSRIWNSRGIFSRSKKEIWGRERQNNKSGRIKENRTRKQDYR